MSKEEIKKALGTKDLVLGEKNTLKALRRGSLVKVFLADNAPTTLMRDAEHYAEITGVELEKLDISNNDLGVLCKKPFPIVCVGMKQAKKKKKY